MTKHTIAFLVAAACFGCDMPIEKQIVQWPLRGGLDTKTGPLAQQPGSFLTLDNVRMERLDEWRKRDGLQRSALDDSFGPPLRIAELPGGGLFGLDAGGTNASAGVTYSRNVPATGTRWVRQGTGTSQTTPSSWKRRAVGASKYPPYLQTMATGNGFRLVAWKPGNATIGQDSIQVTMTAQVDGKTILSVGSFGSTSATSPKAVFAADVFLLFFADGTDLKVAKWNGLTGAFVSLTTLKTNMIAAPSQFIDAIYYGGTNVTVVYRFTGGNIRHLEVTPSSLATPTDADLGITCQYALSLLPDPDSSGVRFVAATTAAPEVHVLRVTSAGVVSTDSNIEAIIGLDIVGCAYQAGASWMVVYRHGVTNHLRAVKRYSGAVGAVLQLTPSYGIGTNYVPASNAWREPGTDAMRYLVSLTIGSFAGTSADFQQNFYEMALDYDNGGSTVGNRFTEPQARLLPLNAGPPPAGFNACPQVQRLSANNFAVPLARISNPAIAAGLNAHEYAVDAWDQRVLDTTIYTATGPNLGHGIRGPQTSFLPAGLLLQSSTGGFIFGHGGSGLPFRATCALAAAGAGLTVGQAYQYVVTINYPDEAGDLWRSSPSIASAAITITGGNQQVDVTVYLPTLENANRLRVIKLWRTLGNGSVYRLVHQRTTLSDSTNGLFVYNDTTTDTALAAGSSFLPPGAAASITPAFNHVAFFDGRMFGAQRDFPARLSFSRRKEIGIQYEFPAEFIVNLEDENGDITSIEATEDKLLVFKGSAIYAIPLGGPNQDGSGAPYVPSLITSEVGADEGLPTMSTGQHVWFMFGSPYRISRSLQVEHIGSPIERWFDQSLVQTPERALSFTFNDARMEVRLLSTNYRFVYDMTHAQWVRDTFHAEVDATIPYFAMTLSGVGDYIQRSSQMWFDYDTQSNTYTTDPSGAFVGYIRSPWMRLAKAEGYMRLMATRSIWLRTSGGDNAVYPTTKIYFDNDDTLYEEFTPDQFDNPTAQTIEFRTRKQKCSTFSIELQFAASDQHWRVDQWSVRIGIKPGVYRRANAAVLGRTVTTLPPLDLWLWLKADVGVTEVLGVASAWADQSGNGRHVTAAALSNPGYVASGIDGMPSIDLDIFDDQRFENTTENIPAGARTVMIVCQPDGVIGGTLMAFRRGIQDWACYMYEVGGSPPQFVWSDGLANIQATTPANYSGAPRLIEHIQNGANALVVRVDGNVIATTTNTTTNENGTAGFVIGNRAPGGYTQGWVGLIAEIMVWSRALTVQERANVVTYLQGRYPSVVG